MSTPEVIQIDVENVLRRRVPRIAAMIPRPVTAWLERVIRQKELNALLRSNRGRTGSAFCRGVLADLDVQYRLLNPERMPARDDSRVVYVSNHPLGGLDGMCIIDMIAQRHGCEPRFVVNDLLMAVEPLRDTFLPVNKHGAQTRGTSGALDDALAGQAPVIVFPAGLVSRRGPKGVIADLRWHKMFVNKCIASQRDVIPLYFDARNSSFFYTFARLRTRLGLKFNLEMLLLPAELFKSRGARYCISVGERVPYTRLRGGRRAQAEADAFKSLVYTLGHPFTPQPL